MRARKSKIGEWLARMAGSPVSMWLTGAKKIAAAGHEVAWQGRAPALALATDSFLPRGRRKNFRKRGEVVRILRICPTMCRGFGFMAHRGGVPTGRRTTPDRSRPPSLCRGRAVDRVCGACARDPALRRLDPRRPPSGGPITADSSRRVSATTQH